MLLMPNKKKMASVIVATLGKKKPDHVQALGEESGTGEYKLPEDEGSDDMTALEACMDDFLKAVEAKDAKAMAAALKSALVCAKEPEAEAD